MRERTEKGGEKSFSEKNSFVTKASPARVWWTRRESRQKWDLMKNGFFFRIWMKTSCLKILKCHLCHINYFQLSKTHKKKARKKESRMLKFNPSPKTEGERFNFEHEWYRILVEESLLRMKLKIFILLSSTTWKWKAWFSLMFTFILGKFRIYLIYDVFLQDGISHFSTLPCVCVWLADIKWQWSLTFLPPRSFLWDRKYMKMIRKNHIIFFLILHNINERERWKS